MNRIIKSAKLDFYSANSAVITLILLFALNVAISFLLRNPYSSITYSALISATLSGSIFFTHEGSHSGKLYGILPVRKHEVVVGRYIYGMTIGVINFIFAYILAVAVAITFNMQPSLASMAPNYLPLVALMFIYYCLSVGISYPLYFAIGYKKFMIIIPVILNLLFSLYIFPFIYTMNPDSPGWIDRHWQFFTGPYFWVTIGIGFAIGLALTVISVVVAYMIYRRKEI